MQNPTKEDWKKLLHVVMYLNRTQDYGIMIKPNSLELIAYADASFATYKLDSKGHTGVVFCFGEDNTPIFTSSRKQTFVCSSSTEAEILAVHSAITQLDVTIAIIKEILGTLMIQNDFVIFEDNKSTIEILTKSSTDFHRKGI